MIISFSEEEVLEEVSTFFQSLTGLLEDFPEAVEKEANNQSNLFNMKFLLYCLYCVIPMLRALFSQFCENSKTVAHHSDIIIHCANVFNSIYIPTKKHTHVFVQRYSSMYLFIHLSIHLSIHPSFHLSMYPFVHSSIHLPWLPIHPFIHPSIHTSDHLSIYLLIHPFVHPFKSPINLLYSGTLSSVGQCLAIISQLYTSDVPVSEHLHVDSEIFGLSKNQLVQKLQSAAAKRLSSDKTAFVSSVVVPMLVR